MKILKLSSKWVPYVEVKLDDEDFERVRQHNWRIHTHGDNIYFFTKINIDGKQKYTSMHRFILEDYNSSMDIDHIDSDGTNNQKLNLQRLSKSDNYRKRRSVGKSQYTGVQPYGKKWKANITNRDGKQEHISTFDEEWHAALAYNIMSQLYFGNQGKKNILPFRKGRDSYPFDNYLSMRRFIREREQQKLEAQYTKEKNITYDKMRQLWIVKYKRQGKVVNVGRYKTLKAAVIARDEALTAAPEPSRPGAKAIY